MLNFVKAQRGTNELMEATNNAMSIIDLYPDIFPHLYKQGFKLEKYFEKGNVILQDGVIITFGRYKVKEGFQKTQQLTKKVVILFYTKLHLMVRSNTVQKMFLMNSYSIVKKKEQKTCF